MKKVVLIIVKRKSLFHLVCYSAIFCMLLFLLIKASFDKDFQAFNNSKKIYNIGDYNIQELEKENSKLKDIFTTLIPKEQVLIYEDEYRNLSKVSSLPSSLSPLSKIITEGVKVEFKTILDDPQNLRPLYDPSWKGSYFRYWLYLPYKNIEARHRIFAYSIGGSENYDIFGSLGFSTKVKPSAPIDNHQNINFLI